MNKQQRKIAKLSKAMYKLQIFNNPLFCSSYNDYYKKIKWLYRNMSDKEYNETLAWCRYLLERKKNEE
ncbi:MAG: hypothetical protein ACRCX2_10210 [Paraclostridium sp.]